MPAALLLRAPLVRPVEIVVGMERGELHRKALADSALARFPPPGRVAGLRRASSWQTLQQFGGELVGALGVSAKVNRLIVYADFGSKASDLSA